MEAIFFNQKYNTLEEPLPPPEFGYNLYGRIEDK
jgi:hypothetical protein